MELKQVCAVITGGASGLGQAAAAAIVAEGGKVCIVDFNKEWGEEAAQALGENAYFEAADVSDSKRAEEIVQGAVAKFGYVNVVVNCAGIGSGTRILPREGGVFPIETFKRVIDINLIGTFNYTCQGALAMSAAPANEDGERGVIINTTSASVTHGQIGQAAYAASKGAVHSMTLPIARELARVGIRINTICPGLVTTNIRSIEFKNMPNVRTDHLPEPPDSPAYKHFVFPLRRGRATEFASLACEIIRNGIMNGATYPLDGAMRLGPKW
jgi:NAD(P)-dependent dehydrogenase (short-subunit alcohol dehydrogenase family)